MPLVRSLVDPAAPTLNLTRRGLAAALASGLAVLAINKLVVHDRGSFWGGVLVVGFLLGVVAIRLGHHILGRRR
jgi:hypothetical protein